MRLKVDVLDKITTGASNERKVFSMVKLTKGCEQGRVKKFLQEFPLFF